MTAEYEILLRWFKDYCYKIRSRLISVKDGFYSIEDFATIEKLIYSMQHNVLDSFADTFVAHDIFQFAKAMDDLFDSLSDGMGFGKYYTRTFSQDEWTIIRLVRASIVHEFSHAIKIRKILC